MKLLTFDPGEILPFMVNDSVVTGKDLFEAFFIIYRGGDHPSHDTVRLSIRLSDAIEARTIPGGSITLVGCPFCTQRIASHNTIRTLKDDSPFHVRLEDKEFVYIQECFKKWTQVTPELRRYFGYLLDLMESAKSMSADAIDAVIAKRGNKVESATK